MFSLILNKQISRPDLWALHLKCVVCDWRTTPEGPYRIRDVLWWIERCPKCDHEAVMVLPDCPHCQEEQVVSNKEDTDLTAARNVLRMFRIPRSLSQALWGHFTCRHCKQMFDKWGRKIESN